MDNYNDILKTVCAPDALKAQLRKTVEVSVTAITDRPYLPEMPSEPLKRRNYRLTIIITAAVACVVTVTAVCLFSLSGQTPPPVIIPTPSATSNDPGSQSSYSNSTQAPGSSSETNTHETRNMTLDDVRFLAQKHGNNLSFGHLSDFIGVDIGSGLYIMQYEVDGGKYRLMVGFGGRDADTPAIYAMFGRVTNNQLDENAIDIRHSDVDKYINNDIKSETTTNYTSVFTEFSITTSLSPGPPVEKFIRDADLSARLAQYWHQAQSSRRVADQPPAPGSTTYSVYCDEFTFGIASGVLYGHIPEGEWYLYDIPKGMRDFIGTTYKNSKEPEVPYGTVSKLHISFVAYHSPK